MKYLIITTINDASLGSFARLSEFLSGWEIVVVGDNKTPNNWVYPGVRFISLEEQMELFQNFAKAIPLNSYSRKNIGYVYAIRNGASIIAETDDDNYPYDNFLSKISPTIEGYSILNSEKWVNIYRLFTKQKVWPRGFPLEYVQRTLCKDYTPKLRPVSSSALVQQYLENGDTDVDAIYRLTINENINFSLDTNIFLEKGQWCPFNSQNTLWFKEAFPLMYLPSFVSFRMTDIWRSFIAQACLHAMNEQIAFCSPTVYQERNEHNLMTDFSQELPGYLHNDKIIDVLEQVNLQNEIQHIQTNMFECYKVLHDKMGIITKKELDLIELWFEFICGN